MCASSLLGDLFPGEWPPSGSSRRVGGSHPPPSHMAYRRAIATSFEASATAFRQLVVTAAASHSRIFRALLVRLCARASGEPSTLTGRDHTDPHVGARVNVDAPVA